ncbi:COP1-interactive protein 1 isoform X2 [Nematostella vectensis]|nr:COP1-interactive protein 1 isoform X2 [Nematostella vectensis]
MSNDKPSDLGPSEEKPEGNDTSSAQTMPRDKFNSEIEELIGDCDDHCTTSTDVSISEDVLSLQEEDDIREPGEISEQGAVDLTATCSGTFNTSLSSLKKENILFEVDDVSDFTNSDVEEFLEEEEAEKTPDVTQGASKGEIRDGDEVQTESDLCEQPAIGKRSSFPSLLTTGATDTLFKSRATGNAGKSAMDYLSRELLDVPDIDGDMVMSFEYEDEDFEENYDEEENGDERNLKDVHLVETDLTSIEEEDLVSYDEDGNVKVYPVPKIIGQENEQTDSILKSPRQELKGSGIGKEVTFATKDDIKLIPKELGETKLNPQSFTLEDDDLPTVHLDNVVFVTEDLEESRKPLSNDDQADKSVAVGSSGGNAAANNDLCEDLKKDVSPGASNDNCSPAGVNKVQQPKDASPESCDSTDGEQNILKMRALMGIGPANKITLSPIAKSIASGSRDAKNDAFMDDLDDLLDEAEATFDNDQHSADSDKAIVEDINASENDIIKNADEKLENKEKSENAHSLDFISTSNGNVEEEQITDNDDENNDVDEQISIHSSISTDGLSPEHTDSEQAKSSVNGKSLSLEDVEEQVSDSSEIIGNLEDEEPDEKESLKAESVSLINIQSKLEEFTFQIDALEENRQELVAENCQLREELADLENAKQLEERQLLARIETLEEDLSRLSVKNDELDKAIRICSKEKEGIEDSLKHARDQIASLESSSTDASKKLRAEIKILEAQLKQKSQTVDELKSTMDTLMDSASKLEEDKRKIQQQADKRVSEMQDSITGIQKTAANAMDDIRNQLKEREERVQVLLSRLQQADDDKKKLEETLATRHSTANKVHELQVQLKAKDDKVNNLQAKISKLEADMNEQQASKDITAQDRVSELKDLLKVSRESESKLQERIESLREKITGLELAAINDATASKEELESAVEEKAKAETKLKVKISALETKLKKAVNETKRYESSSSQLKQQVKELETDNLRRKQKLSLTEKDRDELERKIAELQAITSELRKRQATHEAANSKLSEDNERLTNNAAAKAQNIERDAIIQQLMDEKSQMSKKLQSKEDELATEKANSQKHTETLSSQRAKEKELHTNIKELEAKITTLTEESQAKLKASSYEKHQLVKNIQLLEGILEENVKRVQILESEICQLRTSCIDEVKGRDELKQKVDADIAAIEKLNKELIEASKKEKTLLKEIEALKVISAEYLLQKELMEDRAHKLEEFIRSKKEVNDNDGGEEVFKKQIAQRDVGRLNKALEVKEQQYKEKCQEENIHLEEIAALKAASAESLSKKKELKAEIESLRQEIQRKDELCAEAEQLRLQNEAIHAKELVALKAQIEIIKAEKDKLGKELEKQKGVLVEENKCKRLQDENASLKVKIGELVDEKAQLEQELKNHVDQIRHEASDAAINGVSLEGENAADLLSHEYDSTSISDISETDVMQPTTGSEEELDWLCEENIGNIEDPDNFAQGIYETRLQLERSIKILQSRHTRLISKYTRLKLDYKSSKGVAKRNAEKLRTALNERKDREKAFQEKVKALKQECLHLKGINDRIAVTKSGRRETVEIHLKGNNEVESKDRPTLKESLVEDVSMLEHKVSSLEKENLKFRRVLEEYANEVKQLHSEKEDLEKKTKLLSDEMCRLANKEGHQTTLLEGYRTETEELRKTLELVKSSKETLAAHSQSLQQAEARAVSAYNRCYNDLSDMMNANLKFKDRVDALSGNERLLLKQVDDFKSSLEEMEVALSQKDADLTKSSQDLQMMKKKEDSLHERIQTLQDDVEKLKAVNRDREQTLKQELNKQMSESQRKDAERIEQIIHNKSEFDRKLHQLQCQHMEQVEGHEGRIRDLKTKLATLENKEAVLTREAGKYHRENVELERNLDAANSRIKVLEKQLARVENRLSTEKASKDDAKEQNEENRERTRKTIGELQAKVKKLSDELVKQKSREERLKVNLRKAKALLSSAKEARDETVQKCNSYSSKLSHVSKKYNDKIQQVERLAGRREALTARLRELQATYGQQRDDLTKRDIAINELTAKLNSLEGWNSDRMESLNRRLDTEKEEGRRLREELQRVRTSLREQTQKVNTLESELRCARCQVGEFSSRPVQTESDQTHRLEQVLRQSQEALRRDMERLRMVEIMNVDQRPTRDSPSDRRIGDATMRRVMFHLGDSPPVIRKDIPSCYVSYSRNSS